MSPSLLQPTVRSFVQMSKQDVLLYEFFVQQLALTCYDVTVSGEIALLTWLFLVRPPCLGFVSFTNIELVKL